MPGVWRSCDRRCHSLGALAPSLSRRQADGTLDWSGRPWLPQPTCKAGCLATFGAPGGLCGSTAPNGGDCPSRRTMQGRWRWEVGAGPQRPPGCGPRFPHGSDRGDLGRLGIGAPCLLGDPELDPLHLDRLMLSERSQTQKNTICIIPCVRVQVQVKLIYDVTSPYSTASAEDGRDRGDWSYFVSGSRCWVHGCAQFVKMY